MVSRRAVLGTFGAGFAGITMAEATSPMQGFRKIFAPMLQAIKTAAYEQIVQNTSQFQFTDAKKANAADAEEVRKFLENGGMYRTEKRPASSKQFASVLFFEKPVSFMVGTSNIVSPTGGQATVGQNITIPQGIYIFNYDTESGLTLRPYGSEKELLRTAMKTSDALNILSSDMQKINVTAYSANLAAVKSAIAKTVSVYADPANKEMAVLMESVTDGLFSDGNLGRSARFSENYQSDRAKSAVKENVRDLMSHMESGIVKQLSIEVANMTVSLLGMTSPSKVDQARSELLAENKTVDNMAVSFEAEMVPNSPQFRLVMVVSNGTEFEAKSSTSYNPIIQYRIAGGQPGGRVTFPNSYTREGRGFVDGLDYDNAASSSEQVKEARLTALSIKATGNSGMFVPDEVKLFVVKIAANGADLVSKFADSYRRAEGI